MNKPNPLWLLPPLAAGSAALLPALVALGFEPSPTKIIGILYGSNDQWSNYDFNHHYYPFQPHDVDWPVNAIYVNEATINDVKDYLTDRWSSWGWGRVTNADKNLWFTEDDFPPPPGVQFWDTDSGVQAECERGYSLGDRKMHTRFYAPDGEYGQYLDYFWDVGWGYYIVGTSHYDFNHTSDCTAKSGTQKFGWSEEVEDRIASMFDVDFPVDHNPYWTQMQNSGNGYYSWASDHYHQSEGHASYVYFTAW